MALVSALFKPESSSLHRGAVAAAPQIVIFIVRRKLHPVELRHFVVRSVHR